MGTPDTATDAGAAHSSIDTELWTIGSYNNGDAQQFTGYICNLSVWNSVLTQAQIKNIMFSDYEDAKGKLGNPVHWWACDEQSGTTLVDQGSNGLNLTVTGT